MFSTPVSSLKAPRNQILKLKSTRFQLPTPEEKPNKKQQSSGSLPLYVNVSQTPFIIIFFILNLLNG